MVNTSHFIDLTLSDNEDDLRHTKRSGPVRTNITRPSSFEPSTYISKRDRICLACGDDPELSSGCDGESPCSWCAERGISCLYPGNGKSITLNLSLRSQDRSQLPRVVQRLGPASLQPRDQQAPAQYPSTSSKKIKPDFSRNAALTRDGPRPHPNTESRPVVEEESFNEESDSDDGPPLALNDIEQVTRLLKKHEARLKAHQEYLLRPILSRAKLEATKSSRPQSSTEQRNPFSELTNASRTGVGANQRPSSVSLLMKSHKTGAPKKWTTVAVPLVVVKTSSTILPKYKSIGRLGSSLLARNSGVLKYLPYFADVEKFPEADKKRVQDLEDYYHTDEHRMRNQRTCFELAGLWKPWVEQFALDLGLQLKDIMWYMLDDMEGKMECNRCKTSLRSMIEIETSNRTRPKTQDNRSLPRARLAASAFGAVAGFNIWHIIIEINSVKQAVELAEQQRKELSTLCTICFLHNCIIHGAYSEPEDTTFGAVVFSEGNKQGQSSVKINDDERHLNTRQMAVVPNRDAENIHQCGLYCVDPETSIRAILGRKQGGGADGVYNHATNATRPGHSNHGLCSLECFWQPERRVRFSKVSQTKSFEPEVDAEEKRLFRLLLRLHCNNQRVPCMIAADIEGLTCMDAFYYVLATTQRHIHTVQNMVNTDHQGSRKTSKMAQGLDTSESNNWKKRPPFIPCSHEGLCQNNPDCSCSKDHVHCEHFCGCDISCKRRYRGCSCAGSNKVCFDDSRCECWNLNRECDPWLCGSCGAMDVLDPANKYNEEIRKGRCKNTKIQLELPARTIRAPSEVQGWGLFAGQDLEKNAFIGEYKGERVSNQESNRRGTVYHHLGQEYLFMVNRDQEIDGSNFGNKMRFINNSMREKDINVQSKNLLCNGVQRIMLYARCTIKAGEELLYNYGYPEAVWKTFWERGEGPDTEGLAKPTIPIGKARMAKKIGQPSDDGPSGPRTSFEQPAARQASMANLSEQLPNKRSVPRMQQEGGAYGQREVKRKRQSNGDLSPAHAIRVRNDKDFVDEDDVSEFEGDLVTTSTDDDEHLLEEDDAESSSHEENEPTVLGRPRRIAGQDKRQGGYAQKAAWDTRKRKPA